MSGIGPVDQEMTADNSLYKVKIHMLVRHAQNRVKCPEFCSQFLFDPLSEFMQLI